MNTELEEWNDANKRARREYQDHPIASCLMPGRFNIGADICREHEREILRTERPPKSGKRGPRKKRPECGDIEAWALHQSVPEDPCQACRVAAARYVRAVRRRRNR